MNLTLDQLLEHLEKRFDRMEIDIKAIRQDFNTFEAGRLTDLTAKVAVLEEQLKREELNPLKRIGYKVVEYVILAVIAAIMFLVIK